MTLVSIEFLKYIQTQTAEFFGFWVGACVNRYNNPYVKNTTQLSS